jgi:hypothetical protein
MQSLLETDNVIFVKFPEVNSPKWPNGIINLWNKSFKKQSGHEPWKDYIFVQISGTTFSGLSTRTTLGNTFRALLYSYYYMEQAGFASPWLSGEIFSMASGDDNVIFTSPEISDRLKASIELLTAPSKDFNGRHYGLGQCIKEIEFSKCTEFSFCSKWFHSPTGSVADLTYSRDVKKLFQTKQYFTGRNEEILRNPYLHREAILQGFECEQVSILAEDMLRMQRDKLQ